MATSSEENTESASWQSEGAGITSGHECTASPFRSLRAVREQSDQSLIGSDELHSFGPSLTWMDVLFLGISQRKVDERASALPGWGRRGRDATNIAQEEVTTVKEVPHSCAEWGGALTSVIEVCEDPSREYVRICRVHWELTELQGIAHSEQLSSERQRKFMCLRQ